MKTLMKSGSLDILRVSEISCVSTLLLGALALLLPIAINAQAKPQITGLVSMGDIGFAKMVGVTPDNDCEEIRQHQNVFDGQVINVTWSQLQNGPGTLNTTAIDDALRKIATYNTNHSRQVVAKLRVWAGVNTPQWVMAADGSVTVQLPVGAHPVNSCGGTANTQPETTTSAVIPLYWTESYRQHFKALQTLLAAKYDTLGSGIQEVSVSACSSTTDEPFVEPLGSSAALVGAGYTDQQMKSCLNNMGDTYSAWVNTPLEYPIALFHTISQVPPNATAEDDTFMINVMNGWLHSQLPNQGVHILSNHALVAVPQGTPPNPQSYAPQCQLAPLYTQMASMQNKGAVFAFQTTSDMEMQSQWSGYPTNIPGSTDYDQTFNMGFNVYLMKELELWGSTVTTFRANGPIGVHQGQATYTCSDNLNGWAGILSTQAGSCID